jgi:hypothetical protein
VEGGNFRAPTEIFANTSRAVVAGVQITWRLGAARAVLRPPMTFVKRIHMGSESFGVTRWIELIRAEYREMPGLNLTKPQMRRLWGLDEAVCNALIDALVASRVLTPSVGGTYVLADRRA